MNMGLVFVLIGIVFLMVSIVAQSLTILWGVSIAASVLFNMAGIVMLLRFIKEQRESEVK